MTQTSLVMATTIRRATEGDLNAIVAMGGRFLDSSTYKGLITDSPQHRASLTLSLIQSPNATVLVAEQEDQDLVGFLGLYTHANPLSGQEFCCEVAWWVELHARGKVGLQLLMAGEAWAKEQGAEIMLMIAPTEDVEALYKRKGYVPVERNFQKRIR